MTRPVDIESLRRSEFPADGVMRPISITAGTGFPLPRRHVAAASAFLAACCEGKPPTTPGPSREIQLAALPRPGRRP